MRRDDDSILSAVWLRKKVRLKARLQRHNSTRRRVELRRYKRAFSLPSERQKWGAGPSLWWQTVPYPKTELAAWLGGNALTNQAAVRPVSIEIADCLGWLKTNNRKIVRFSSTGSPGSSVFETDFHTLGHS